MCAAEFINHCQRVPCGYNLLDKSQQKTGNSFYFVSASSCNEQKSVRHDLMETEYVQIYHKHMLAGRLAVAGGHDWLQVVTLSQTNPKRTCDVTIIQVMLSLLSEGLMYWYRSVSLLKVK